MKQSLNDFFLLIILIINKNLCSIRENHIRIR
jgi:hypothetical protein